MQKKQMLEDVVILRLLLIFLLVWYHAFCPFTGAWSAIDGYPDSTFYYWCGKSLTLVRIQTLIFISGYLLGYNANRKPDALNFNGCVVKKLKRLILPSVIFSTIYYAIFYDLSEPWYKISYDIINGCGHLWFLPMIFWCFVGVYIVEKIKIKTCYVVALGVLASILSVNIFPLRLGNAMSYFILFYLGYGIKRGYFDKLVNNIRLEPIICCALVYIVGIIANEQMLNAGGVIA